MALIRPFALTCLLPTAFVFGAAPSVVKVEPPNWWANHSVNPVRMLIRGSGFGSAKVEVAGAGFTASRIRSSENGHYLFFDLTIPATAAPGPVKISVTSPSGSATIPFEVLPALPPAGRFQGFSPADVIYLIMPDRFANGDVSNDDPPQSPGLLDRGKPRYYHGGDLQGVIDHLPYLKDLGVTALWLNPVYDNVNHLNTREIYDGQPITDYHGYGAVDFYAVDEHLGTLSKFRELVDAAHQVGMKVIQDQVANHCGPFHPWVTDSPTPTWFNGTESKHIAETWQTWTLMDPHSTVEMRKPTIDGWFLNILPDLNQNDPEVARYLVQNTLWWVGITGLDGIRQDTWPYVPRTFWHAWMVAIKMQYPRMRVVGEMFDGDPALVAFFQGGAKRFDGVDTGVDSLFDFPLYYTLRAAFAQGKPIREIPSMLAHDYLYPNAGMLVTFLGLHDVQRFMSERGATVEGLKLAFTVLMTTRGIPLIFYGDEIAMSGGVDPDNRRDFPGGFPGDRENAFEKSGRTEEQESVFAHVRALTRLRAAHDCLQRGWLLQLMVSDQMYAYARSGQSCRAIVVVNNDANSATFAVPLAALRMANGTVQDSLSGPDAEIAAGVLKTTLPARSAAIYIRP